MRTKVVRSKVDLYPVHDQVHATQYNKIQFYHQKLPYQVEVANPDLYQLDQSSSDPQLLKIVQIHQMQSGLLLLEFLPKNVNLRGYIPP